MFYFEMQGLTWRAGADQQHNAILINNEIIQHDDLLTPLYRLDDQQNWRIAIAHSKDTGQKAQQGLKQVLKGVLNQHEAYRINAQMLQRQLVQTMVNNSATHGAISTLITMAYRRDFLGLPVVTAQQLGFNRTYAWNNKCQIWLDNYEQDIGQNYNDMYSLAQHYFCADRSHQINEMRIIYEEFLWPGDAVLMFTKGVLAVLKSHRWPPLLPNTRLSTWLLEMKQALKLANFTENVSMVIVRRR